MLTRNLTHLTGVDISPSVEQSIFEYTDPIEFLNASFQKVREKSPQFSLRSWSKQIGFNHVAMLSMILNRKRKLLPNNSSKISSYFLNKNIFTEKEARYFEMLVLFSNARTDEEKEFYRRILSTLRPDKRFSTLGLDRIRLIADWYHLAILEMTYLKNFNSDPQWIRLRLGGSVSKSQVQDALERLIRLGLLKKTETGSFQKCSKGLITPTDIPDSSLRNFHAQLLTKAEAALEKQSTEERDITGHVMAISKNKIPEVKKMIREFRKNVADYAETDEAEEVYYLAVQFFNLTKGEHS